MQAPAQSAMPVVATGVVKDAQTGAPDPGFRFYADPFAYVHAGRHYVFVEDLDHRTNKGVISVVTGSAGPIGRSIGRSTDRPGTSGAPGSGPPAAGSASRRSAGTCGSRWRTRSGAGPR